MWGTPGLPTLPPPPSHPPLTCHAAPFPAQGLVARSKADVAVEQNISKISGQRSKEADRVAADLVGSRAELDALRLKYDGSLSRRKTLEAELGSLREKMAVVLDKSQNDNRLIDALRREVGVMRKGQLEAQQVASHAGSGWVGG